MDKLIRSSIARMQQMVKQNTSWKPNEAWKQSFFSFSDKCWRTLSSAPREVSPFTTLALYSWNIDFMLPFAHSRMQKALECLRNLSSAQPETTATIIFLQECTTTDLDCLAGHGWVRSAFRISDLDTSCWSSGHYGTVTLVDKRLQVNEAFRVHYEETRMQRDAFFTDVKLGHNSIIRVCNSHLESMAFEPPMRPHQMALIAKYMHSDQVLGAITAGDFNAIQDFDRTLHSENNLKDAYLELGGQEDTAEGYTWGQQAATKLRQQFGLSRMDKIFFCGALQLESFERFGADVEVEVEDERAAIIELGFDRPWITDHFGVKAVFHIDENDVHNLAV